MKKMQSSDSVKRSYKGYKQTEEIIADDTDITTSHEVLCNTTHTHMVPMCIVQPLDTFQLFFSSNIHKNIDVYATKNIERWQ